MTNPFLKRVDLLTDWHNRFPDANVDLLAEIILDAWQLAEETTEERIIKLLKKEIKNVIPGFGQSRFIAGLERAIVLIKGETE